tara:strand:+ start:3251 stop:3385 length:135 start_codon:yes stop_codon:yes gene_type:complete
MKLDLTTQQFALRDRMSVGVTEGIALLYFFGSMDRKANNKEEEK